MAKLPAVQAVEPGVARVKLGAQDGPALLIPLERGQGAVNGGYNASLQITRGTTWSLADVAERSSNNWKSW